MMPQIKPPTHSSAPVLARRRPALAQKSASKSRSIPWSFSARPVSPSQPLIGSGGWDTGASYSSGNSYSAYAAPAAPAFGINGNLDLGFPGQGLINTALTIVFSLIGLSLLVQVSYV